MLGCQDFCGYYEWTFHYLRRRFGQEALEKYWAQAIAADAQRHYIESAQYQGLRGLYESWSKTGVDEQCDWSVTLDEDHNLLRLDMRQCPSKGFLLNNGLNADEDYCDHCMGWIGPALHQIGAEVAAHEHNHCGQCWWEVRAVDDSQSPVEVSADIRHDPRWGQGYLHRYAHHAKQPLIDGGENADPCEVLERWFSPANRLVVLAYDENADGNLSAPLRYDALIATGRRYAAGHLPTIPCRGVLLEHDPDLLPAVSERYRATPPASRPLLMHAFLPHATALNFVEAALPRPVPVLPLLIRSALYVHQAERPCPATYVFALLVSIALGKHTALRGVDFGARLLHPNNLEQQHDSVPMWLRELQVDLEWMKHAWRRHPGELELPPELQRLLEQRSEREECRILE